MSRNEPSTPDRGPSEREPRGPDPTTWVVGSTETECGHPEEARERLGGDGQNGYYRCGRCDAGLVVQDEVGEFV